MPTLEERGVELALDVSQLRERLALRRADQWWAAPTDTAQDRKRHWERVTERYKEKLTSGEYISDDLLPALRADKAMNLLGREFIDAAETGSAQIVRVYIEEGFPANWQDPLTGESALHGAAGTRARAVLRVLVESGRCNFLLRDRDGRLASEMAFLHGDDPASARWLRIHERRQAAARGIKLTRRPRG